MRRQDGPVPTARRPAVGFLLVGLGASLFIVNAGVSRVVLRNGGSPAELTTLRITGTALVLLVVTVFLDRGALQPPSGRLGAPLPPHGLIAGPALQWTYFVAIG